MIFVIEFLGGDNMRNYPRLRDLRTDKDIRQEEIARLLGTTKQQYSLWERGDREIPFHHVITLAIFYNVSLDYLADLISVPRKLR
jgi:transcriptional regulator with XRE-family HTH domain